MAKATSWVQVPGAVSEAMQGVHQIEGEPKNKSAVIAILDFNVPNSRDSTKLKDIAQAISTIFKNHGRHRCVLLAHMAAYPKEDSCDDPIDDEHAIYTAFTKVGFGAQQRVRCLLTQPPGIENHLKVGDWFVDSRLMYLAPNDMAARGDAKGQLGNDWRIHSELARRTQITKTPMLPNPAEYLHVGGMADVKVNKEDKAAQRGPEAAKFHLEALLNSGVLEVPVPFLANQSLSCKGTCYIFSYMISSKCIRSPFLSISCKVC